MSDLISDRAARNAQRVSRDGAWGEDAPAALEDVATTKVPYVIDVPTSMKTSFKDIVQPLASGRWRGGD